MPLLLRGLRKQSDSAAGFLTLICTIWETRSEAKSSKATGRIVKKVAGSVLPFLAIQAVF